MPLTLYSWRRKDPHTGRWRLLRWKMTDEDAKQWAAKEGAEIAKVDDGSGEARTPVEIMRSGTMPARADR